MATHGTTRATPHKNIFNMAAIVMDNISSDSGIFCDSELYHSYFRYNISFIDPSLGGFRISTQLFRTMHEDFPEFFESFAVFLSFFLVICKLICVGKWFMSIRPPCS